MLAQLQNDWQSGGHDGKHGCQIRSSLERKGLICTEPTTVTTKAGVKRNGNLLYTVSPFQDVLETHYQRQLERLAQETARAHLQLGA